MTATRAAATTATLLALALTLNACGQDDSDGSASSDAAGETPTTSDASPEPTTSAAPEPLPSSYPEVGLTYKNLPELDGEYRDALTAFIAYDRARLKLLREARMNPELKTHAAPKLVARFTNTVDYLVEHDTYYRGSTVTTLRELWTRNRMLGFDICLDGSGLRWLENGQPVPVPGEPREVFRIVVTNVGGTWKATDFEPQGAC